MLAGGNGIPGPYYHAIDLSKRESSTKQQIKLTWIIRNPDALQWFHKELEVLAHTNVQTDIYITAQDQTKEKLEVNVEEKKMHQVMKKVKFQIQIQHLIKHQAQVKLFHHYLIL